MAPSHVYCFSSFANAAARVNWQYKMPINAKEELLGVQAVCWAAARGVHNGDPRIRLEKARNCHLDVLLHLVFGPVA
eukprot:2748217-Ditylum_brightwellii.AAC.1